PNFAHTNSVRTYSFKKEVNELFLLVAGLSSSTVYDFLCKSTGKSNLHQMLDEFPIQRNNIIEKKIAIRILMLNSVTNYYANLWESSWIDDFRNTTWTKNDRRLSKAIFNSLGKEWSSKSFFKTKFERRQALLEIDVLSAI